MIDKAQGQSLEEVGVNLREAVFTHGQLYVALSSTTRVARMKILMKPDAQKVTQNIAYPEVLLALPGN
jgi:hypothetical protein